MNYLVLDLETTSKTVKKRKGNFIYNTILCSGYKYQNKEAYSSDKDYITKGFLSDVNRIIGHNIKYDLLHIWRNEELQSYFKTGGQVWDTQLTEYILSGQLFKYPGLRSIAVDRYGCKERSKNLEAYKIGKDLDTTLIPIEELLEDVQGDVLDTEQVALGQLKLCKENGMMHLVKAQMDAILATTEMEFNGMYINKKILQANKEHFVSLLEEANKNIQEIANQYLPDFNPKSPSQVSLLLFGGILKTKEKEQIGVFKSGINKDKPKYKNVIIENKIKGLSVMPLKSWKGTKEGQYITNESILKQIYKRISSNSYDAILPKNLTDAYMFCREMLKSRELNKGIDAYYTTTEEFISDHDSCVHPEYSHCGYERGDDAGGGTATGRLSCRHPNAQQVPRDGKVKDHFTSRYGKEGRIINFDYKQLEVIVFAFLTQDTQLLYDIRNGVDIHRMMYANCYDVLPEDVTSEQRTGIKGCTFHVVYGGGPNSMSTRMNLDIDFCKRFILKFYERYPMAKAWQENLVRSVEGSKIITSDITPKGHRIHRGYFKSITGRRYEFSTKDSPDFMVAKGIMTSFNPPDIKNYPVQGLATADIVLIMLGRLWRKAIHHRDKFLLINTVHDSIMIDCRLEHEQFCIDLVKKELESVTAMMREVFNINFNLDVLVDHSSGLSWGEC